MNARTWRTAALVLLVMVLAAAAAVAGFVITDRLRTVEPGPHVATEPSAYAAADDAPATPRRVATPAVDRAALLAAIAPALRASGLGSSVLASVVDARRGSVLVNRSAATAAAPASTAKLTTAVAVLTVRKATDRITTTAVSDGSGTLTLVGAGDPTLSAAPAGQAPEYAGAARLGDLAAQVKRSGVPVRRIVVASRFAGPVVSPSWASEDVPSDYGAGITGLMADGGRAAPGDTIRSAEPDLAAARSFASLLGQGSVPITRGSVPAGSRTVGTVRSAPLGVLVEQMLLESDNVIAECLARQVAIATGAPATFTGGAGAVRQVLRSRVNVDIGPGLVDGSGLAARDRLTPATLTALLRVVVTSGNPSVRGIAASLPVAGWSGSLAGRYLTGGSVAGAGVVRAKTGTLTGVSTLAGLAHTRRGGLVVFAVFADRNTSTPAAQAALDDLVTRLTTCAC